MRCHPAARSFRLLAIGALLAAPAVARAQAARPVLTARLDHLILVVPDLDSATAPLEQLGFRLKPGRLHANNLINRHVKFRDGTGIELMSLAGPPRDSMAIRYRQLLERGAGGAYVALRSEDLGAVAAEARRLGLTTRLSSSGAWRFLDFPGESDASWASDASAVFFVSGGTPANDPDSLVAHPNRALALTQAWVEGGPLLDSLLHAAGGRHVGSVRGPDARAGTRWQLASGQVIVVSRDSPRAWPRPLGAVVGRAQLAPVPVSLHRLPIGVWIALMNDTGTD
ncbi:MAG: VOC family protein [Gemmatimonadota bacterium]